MKTCSRCLQIKPVAMFGVRRERDFKPTPRCKECMAEIARNNRAMFPERCKEQKERYNLKHPGLNKKRAARWREENPDKYKAGWFRSIIKAKYGITLEDYNEILSMQSGKCAICGMTTEEHGMRLHVDHCHKTGLVRGLLCSNCNIGIGNLGDNPLIVKHALSYLLSHKAMTMEGKDGHGL